ICTTAEIDECVSDVFAEIFMKYDSEISDERDMRGYTGTVAKRRAVDYFRKYSSEKRRTIRVDEESIGTVVSDVDIEGDSDKKENQSILLQKLEQLGEPDSEIIIRKYYYGQNASEIARRLNLKASSVRSRCKRALEKLRTMLAEVGISM
ncbi:MAG: sigma-70 family RNA polymerase sigma factor, partial [Ruminococcus sp.]|nr:sigma-70 family RNA polymerase sigma factor [Ruminococcus sp.]